MLLVLYVHFPSQHPPAHSLERAPWALRVLAGCNADALSQCASHRCSMGITFLMDTCLSSTRCYRQPVSPQPRQGTLSSAPPPNCPLSTVPEATEGSHTRVFTGQIYQGKVGAKVPVCGELACGLKALSPAFLNPNPSPDFPIP